MAQNNRPTSDVYKQAYQILINNECDQQDVPTNLPVTNHHLVPPPLRNNLKPVDSPLRRPLSTSEDDRSELEDFEQDPNTKTIYNHRKKTKVNNHSNSKQNNSNRIQALSPPEQTHMPHQQQQCSRTNESTSANKQLNIDSSTINILTNEAKSFARTRYPFPPFIIRFPTSSIQEQKVAEELCKFLKENKNVELDLSGYRKTSTKCSSNECDLLLFVKNSYSFSILYDETNWAQSLLGSTYTRLSSPSIPPQLSLIVKNVSLSIDFVKFVNEIKATYSNVRNVIRLKNKNQMHIKLVKLEFTEPCQRDEILNRRKIFINSLSYDIDEYMAPARVLICSKCMGLGHFRKQCKQKEDTCKKCGMTFNDIKDHTASCSQLHCIHYQGDHMSNDMKCPKVKQFRADLTKVLLSSTVQINPHNNIDLSLTNFPPMNPAQRSTIYSDVFNNKYNNKTNKNNNVYHYNLALRTMPPNTHHWTSNNDTTNSIVNKIDELKSSMNHVNALLEKIINRNNHFENFMKDKIINDEIISNKIDELLQNNNNQKINITQHEIKITHHENVFKKIVLPLLDEISLFLSNLNIDKYGKTLDADLKVKINRWRAQLNNVRTSKDF